MNAQVGKALTTLGALEQRGAQWSITSTKHHLQLTVGYAGAIWSITLPLTGE